MSDPADERHCRYIERCPMFPLFQSRHVLRIYQIHYCESGFEECERYQQAQSGEMPPADLLPDGKRLGR